MTRYNVDQRTPEWKKLRYGRATAYNFCRIVGKNGNLINGHDTYITELITQAFIDDWEPDFKGTKWTERGTGLETEARIKFSIQEGLVVRDGGFILHSNGILGCSPDGVIEEDGVIVDGVEIKAPAPHTHIGWIREGGLPDCHVHQCHGSMICCEVKRWNFFSYYPGLQSHHVKVEWNKFTDTMEESLMEFCDKYRKAYAEALPKLILKENSTLN